MQLRFKDPSRGTRSARSATSGRLRIEFNLVPEPNNSYKCFFVGNPPFISGGFRDAYEHSQPLIRIESQRSSHGPPHGNTKLSPVPLARASWLKDGGGFWKISGAAMAQRSTLVTWIQFRIPKVDGQQRICIVMIVTVWKIHPAADHY